MTCFCNTTNILNSLGLNMFEIRWTSQKIITMTMFTLTEQEYTDFSQPDRATTEGFPALSDEELVLNAEALFLLLDQAEFVQ